MSKIQDLETIMSEIETIMKANLQSYITDMNTEKGDTLLAAFEPNSYLMYRLDGNVMPNYKISFLQYFNATPTKSITGASAIQAQIAIDIIIDLENDLLSDIRLMRYMRIIKKIIDKKITPNFTSSSIISTDYIQGKDANLKAFLLGQIVIGNINVI